MSAVRSASTSSGRWVLMSMVPYTCPRPNAKSSTPRSQRAHHLLGEDPDEILPRVHRVISHLKTWLQGTHRGVSEEHLQVYLDEFTFRFNRRRTPMAAFQRVLGLGSQQEPTTRAEILAEGPATARRAAELNG